MFCLFCLCSLLVSSLELIYFCMIIIFIFPKSLLIGSMCLICCTMFKIYEQHTHKHIQLFYSSMDFVWDNPGEPVPEDTFIHSHLSWSHQSSFICFFHLIWSMASSLFNPHAWQSFSTIFLQVFFGLPLGLAPSTSYSIHFFTQSLSSFHNTCPYHCSLFYELITGKVCFQCFDAVGWAAGRASGL